MRHIHLIILLIFFAQCKKDMPVEAAKVPEDCRTPRKCENFFLVEYVGPVQNSHPYFNPKNSDEFVYLYKDAEANYSLIVYNMRTHQKTVLGTKHGNWAAYIQWHPTTNVIIYADYSDGFLYKINPDGTGKTQIMNFVPYIYFQVMSGYKADFMACKQTMPYSIVEFDLDGNIIDSVVADYYGFVSDVSIAPQEEMKLVCKSGLYPGAITVYSVMDHRYLFAYIPYEQSYREAPMLSVSWHPNGRDVYYASWFDIQKVNTDAYTHTVVKLGCMDDQYSGVVRVSPDGKRLLVEKIHYWNDESCKLWYNTDLVIMDLDGSNEKSVWY